MKFYYPYTSDRPEKKYFIITNDNKKVYFGQAGASDYTQHKNLIRKNAYIQRHQKREDWGKSGVNSSGWWSYHYLWSYPTKEEAYKKIREKLKGWGII